MFHLVSHYFANYHWTWRFVFLFACVLLGGFCVLLCFGLPCFSSENSAFNSRFNSFEFPVVD